MADAMPIPAVCDGCGTAFPSSFAMAPGARNVTIVGGKSGPCPNCGGFGSIPDGAYEFVDETMKIISTWPASRIQEFMEALEAARNAPDPRAATEAVLAQNDDLYAVAKRLLIPRDAGAFYALLAVLYEVVKSVH